MILVDTSVWIEFLGVNETVFSRMRQILEKSEVVAVEWIFGELLQGARDRRERRIILGYWENLPKIAPDGIWVEAGILSREQNFTSKGVGLIDVAILVSARRANAAVWTLDKKFKSICGKDEIFSTH